MSSESTSTNTQSSLTQKSSSMIFFEGIRNHLRYIGDNLREPIRLDILQTVSYDTRATFQDAQLFELIGRAAALLPVVQTDPTPLANLLITLTADPRFSFADALDREPSVDFTAGLQSPVKAVQDLILSLLKKASNTPRHVHRVAAMQDTVYELVSLMLRGPDTGLSMKAESVLISLLQCENPELRRKFVPLDQHPDPGEGLMWRRVVGDKGIYSLFFTSCAPSADKIAQGISNKVISIAQGRLLDFLRSFINAPQFWRCHFLEDVESHYGVKESGLIEFATLHMIDQSDVLMKPLWLEYLVHMLMTDNETDTIFTVKPIPQGQSPYLSRSLNFLRKSGIHAQMLRTWAENPGGDGLDVATRTADYIIAYALNHRLDFLDKDNTWAVSTIAAISRRLQATPPNIIGNPVVLNDARVLGMLPRTALLAPRYNVPPATLLSLWPANSQFYIALSHIFRGTGASEWGRKEAALLDAHPGVAPDLVSLESLERQAARANFFIYLDKYPDMWGHLVAVMEGERKDVVISAIMLLHSLVEASWKPGLVSPVSLIPDRIETHIPSEGHLSRLRPSGPEKEGLDVLLSPSVLHVLASWLRRPWKITMNPDVYEMEEARLRFLKAFVEKIRLLPQPIYLSDGNPLVTMLDISLEQWQLRSQPSARQPLQQFEVATMNR